MENVIENVYLARRQIINNACEELISQRYQKELFLLISVWFTSSATLCVTGANRRLLWTSSCYQIVSRHTHIGGFDILCFAG